MSGQNKEATPTYDQAMASAVSQAPAYDQAIAAASAGSGASISKQVWQNAGKLGLLGLGVGAGARGLQGIWNLLRRNSPQSHSTATGPLEIELPNTRRDEEEEKFAAVKSAEGSMFDGWLPDIPKFLSGGNASGEGGHPLNMPLKVLGAGAGLYGGWKLVDWIMDQRRKSDMKAEADKARQEYEGALQAQHAKTGSLAADLDALCDDLEKQGTLGDVAGGTAGLYLTLAGAGALLTGKITHDIARKRSQSSVMAKARILQQRRMRALRPATMYVNPLPERAKLKSAPDEDEMDGDPLDKVASGADKIPGGLADGKPDEAFPEEKTEQGEKVEMEHTSDEEIAEEIAKDHITEDPDYYDKLEEIEKKAYKPYSQNDYYAAYRAKHQPYYDRRARERTEAAKPGIPGGQAKAQSGLAAKGYIKTPGGWKKPDPPSPQGYTYSPNGPTAIPQAPASTATPAPTPAAIDPMATWRKNYGIYRQTRDQSKSMVNSTMRQRALKQRQRLVQQMGTMRQNGTWVDPGKSQSAPQPAPQVAQTPPAVSPAFRPRSVPGAGSAYPPRSGGLQRKPPPVAIRGSTTPKPGPSRLPVRPPAALQPSANKPAPLTRFGAPTSSMTPTTPQGPKPRVFQKPIRKPPPKGRTAGLQSLKSPLTA